MSDEDWTIDEEDFERLLGYLAADRDVAAERFVHVWRNLVRTFASRGCHEAEDVADETMFRVARKTRTLRDFKGDFALYIYRVGSFVYREWLRRYLEWLRLHEDVSPPEPPPPPDPPDEELLDCLDQCLDKLSADDREIAVEYYRYSGRERIENRQRLAEKFGLTLNALRIRALKLRAQLKECVERCMGRAGGA
ncbi:MAG: sigma-70 family RNA polymerase sigma factor [Acidobacteria bacterium]|nr:sigma-70 family RNA polymerase sigma factor [Acidobacteriota bacterium]